MEKTNKFIKLCWMLIACGATVVLGYIKCLKDVTKKYANDMPDQTITIQPFKTVEVTMKKKS